MAWESYLESCVAPAGDSCVVRCAESVSSTNSAHLEELLCSKTTKVIRTSNVHASDPNQDTAAHTKETVARCACPQNRFEVREVLVDPVQTVVVGSIRQVIRPKRRCGQAAAK